MHKTKDTDKNVKRTITKTKKIAMCEKSVFVMSMYILISMSWIEILTKYLALDKKFKDTMKDYYIFLITKISTTKQQ